MKYPNKQPRRRLLRRSIPNRKLSRAEAERVTDNKALLLRAKDKACMDCKKPYPYYIMQFDHVHGEKKFNISHMAHDPNMPKAKLVAEISKCEVVCSNCHLAREHHRRVARHSNT